MSKRVALLLVFASVFSTMLSLVPQAYSSEFTETQKAFAFLTEVLQLDLSQYQPQIKNVGQFTMTGIGPTTEVYGSLKNDIQLPNGGGMASMQFILYFANGAPYYYSMSGANVTMNYLNPQPDNPINMSKVFLQRYHTYLTQYCNVDAAYLQPMIEMLNNLTELTSTVEISGNIKLQIDTFSGMQQLSSVQYGWISKTNIKWMYTFNGFDVDRKYVYFNFPNGTLTNFGDTWNLYSVGSWDIIPEEEAVNIAFAAVQDFKLKFGSDSGAVLEMKPDLSNATYDATLYMSSARGLNVLYPFWEVRIYFNKSYYGQYGIQVGIWGDTEEVSYCQSLTALGSPSGDNPGASSSNSSPAQGTPTNPSGAAETALPSPTDTIIESEESPGNQDMSKDEEPKSGDETASFPCLPVAAVTVAVTAVVSVGALVHRKKRKVEQQ